MFLNSAELEWAKGPYNPHHPASFSTKSRHPVPHTKDLAEGDQSPPGAHKLQDFPAKANKIAV